MEIIEKDRVRRNTSKERNEIIDNKTIDQIKYYSSKKPEAIEKRLKKLDSEWDIERILQLNAATLSLMGILFGTKDRRWLLLSGLVAAFLAQHAIQGWCPPLPLLRAIGFRTRQEIDREKYALQILKGGINPSDNAEEIWKMVKE